MIVTTTDINDSYTVIGPVFFQISNKGLFSSTLDDLLQRYELQLRGLEQSGIISGRKTDLGALYGQPSVGQNKFEKAFFVSIEELKHKATALGADAIIGLRQDIDLDTNGIQFFYMSMYGTAVKINSDSNDSTADRTPFCEYLSRLTLCPNCIGKINPGDSICATCGRELEWNDDNIVSVLPEYWCPKCGKRIRPGERLCASCGQLLNWSGTTARIPENSSSQEVSQPTYYQCPKCGEMIIYGTPACPKCAQQFTWNQ